MDYRIKIIPVGFLETNCYALISEDAVILIDPGDEAGKIISALDGRSPDILIITHAHADHIGAIRDIKNKFPSVILMAHPLEFPSLGDPLKNLSFFEGANIISPPADKSIEDGAIITARGRIKLKVIHTPGHTPGSVCFFDQENKIIFTGDTIFKETIGRVDLPGGNEDAMFHSIDRFLKIMSSFSPNDEVIIYAGHGPSTNLSHEKKYNPYFRREL